MAHITSARLRMAERASRKVASKFRRESGVMARAQVKETLPVKDAESFKEMIARDVLSQLSESYPQDGFTHEGDVLKESEEKGLMWHISALGGFDNFIRGKTGFYILYVITDGGKPVEATAYDPLTDNISLSVKGSGVISENNRTRVSGHKTLAGGLVHLAPCAAVDAAKLSEAEAQVRVTGSYLEDILAVCAGNADGFYAREMPQAEALFAALLVTESGGKTSKPAGGEAFIAGNIHCYKELNKIVG